MFETVKSPLFCAPLAAAWLCLLAGELRAQPAAGAKDRDAKPPAANQAADGVREVKPEVYYLRDKDGKLVPVPDFSYEEFKRLYDLDKRLATPTDTPPQFSLPGLSIQGQVKGDRAELRVQWKIHVRHDGWVRIPLRMNQAILREAPHWDGPGRQLLEFDADRDGYVFWVHGADDKPHLLSFDILQPLESAGDEQRLRLTLPKATTSELRLRVSAAQLAARVSEGATLLPLEHPAPDQTEIAALGLGGEFSVGWRTGEPAAMKSLAALEVSGQVLVQIDGPQQITSDARLKVSLADGPLDAFRVRLPPGLEFVPSQEAAYSAAVVDKVEYPATGLVAQIVEVKPRGKNTASLDVRLRAASSTFAENRLPRIEVAGFEVLGAIRQTGVLELAVEGNWAVNWTEGLHVARVDDAPDHPRVRPVVARFEYHRQPCSLQVEIVRKKTRVTVEPSYTLTVGADRVGLEATFKYNVRGLAANELRLDLRGWTLDRVGPDNIVDVENLDIPTSGPLTIPLFAKGPQSGERTVQLLAHRDLLADEPTVTLDLPRPLSTVLTPASVVVAPLDNVELAPRFAEMPGLVAETLPAAVGTMALPRRQQSPLFFRERGVGERLLFVADLRIRPRSVAATQNGQVRIEPQHALVEQRWTFQVAYEAATDFTFVAPRSIVDNGNLKVLFQDDKTTNVPVPVDVLAPSDSATVNETDASDARARGGQDTVLRIRLPHAVIGTCQLSLQYTAALPELAADHSASAAIPLIRPAMHDQLQVGKTAYRISVNESVQLDAETDEWTPLTETDRPLASSRDLVLASTVNPDHLTLLLQRLPTANSSSTVVSHGWVQTWLTGQARQDRAAWRLISNEDRLRLRLPAGSRTSDLLVALNGFKTPFEIVGPSEIVVAVPSDLWRAEFVLECSYTLPAAELRSGSHELHLPRLLSSSGPRRFYWQLVAPQHLHLLTTPAGLTSEMAWKWQGLFGEPQARWSQQELETWINVRAQSDLPARTNQYLFSTFDAVGSASILVMHRSMLLLLVSGVVLSGGLLLLFVPLARHPAVILVVGAALLPVVGLFPEQALFIAQAASLGIGLAVASTLWQRWRTTRHDGQTVIRGTSLSKLDSKIAPRDSRPPAGGYTTTSAPISLQLPAPEPKS